MAMFAENSAIMKHTLVAPKEDVTQVISDTWSVICSEVGTEILLVFLFCAGFALFRVAAIRRVFKKGDAKGCKTTSFSDKGASISKDDCKSTTSGSSDENSSSEGKTPASMAGTPKTMSSDGTEFQQVCRSRSSASVASTAASASSPSKSVAHAYIQRIRNAVQEKHLEKALRALKSMTNAGHAMPSGCVVAVVRLARESKGAGGETDEGISVLRELPEAALSSDAIFAILHYATRSCDTTLLRQTSAKAKELRIAMPPAACEAMLRTYATAGDNYGLEAFEDLCADLSESALITVVSACAESRHVRLAERCLSQARQLNGKLPLQLYTSVMKVYSHSRLFHKTCDLYLAMQQDDVKPDTVAYGCLIRAAVESGRHELARKLFQESGNPDLLNCMSLIRAAGRERDCAKAFRLLEGLEKSPLDVDVAAYNCTLEVCAACGEREAAKNLLNRMEEKNCVDVVSYNTYLKIVMAGGVQENVGAILEGMRSRGVYPNAVTYNSLVKAAVANQDMQGAWQRIKDMEENGVKPDSFTCSILMKGVKHNIAVEDVDNILGLIKRARIVPDEVLVNCLLDGCVRLRDSDRLTDILSQFKSTGVVPSPHAYAMLIKSYGHARRPDQAWALWREVAGVSDGSSSGSGAPSEEVFSSMVDACLNCGDLSGAATVLRQCQPHLEGYTRMPSIFAAVVKACVQNKRARSALDIYEELKDSIQCTKVTYNTLIDALVRQDDLNRATDLFREMALQGVVPDLITYSTLIKGHCSRGDLEHGLQLLGTMQRRGIMPDAILFNSILDGCAHGQMRTLTEQVLRDMEKAGVAPSNFTISILVKLYGRCGDLDAAFKVMETYPQKFGFQLNAQVYTCLMSACIANGEQSRALAVHDTMSQAGIASDSKTYQTLLCGCIRHGDLDGGLSLINDVLNRAKSRQPLPTSLDRESLEGVLMMAVRQGRGDECAMPLLQCLQEAGVFISERVVAAVQGRSDVPSRSRPSSTFVACSGLSSLPPTSLRPRKVAAHA